MKKIILSIVLITAGSISFGQSVGIGTATPDASALLDVSTTTKGFLPPRMTAAQKILIPSPKAGLMIYQTDGAAGLYVYNGTAWATAVATANAWAMGGNSGTDPFTNFIGTTDAKPLVFRVANNYAGRIDNNGMVALGRGAAKLLADSSIVAIGDKALFNNGTGAATSYHGTFNTAVGAHSLFSNTIGYGNTALGFETLKDNSTGESNVGVGLQVLEKNTTGSSNVATGYGALGHNVTGNYNVASGHTALWQNYSGNSNVAIGIAALTQTNTGSNIVAIGDSALYHYDYYGNLATLFGNNTAVGSKALYTTTTGTINTAVGSQALYFNNTGNFNVAMGAKSLYSNASGGGNVAIGANTMYQNLSGTGNVAIGNAALYGNNASGNNNVAIGYNTMLNSSIGFSNVAVGTNALYKNTVRSNLVAIGDSALYNNGDGATSGFQAKENTAVGSKAMFANTKGYRNTAIGFQALMSNTWGNFNTAVGYQSLLANQDTYYNTALGYQTLAANVAGEYNTATGFQALGTDAHGNHNTANGYGTLYHSNGSSENVAFGSNALYNTTSGSFNTGIGSYTLLENNTGDGNTALGNGALKSNVEGSNNSGLGVNADTYYGDMANATAVGANAEVACNNCMVLGSVAGVNAGQSNVLVGIGLIKPESDLHIKQSKELYPVNGGGLRLERKTTTTHWDIATDQGDDLDFSYSGAARGYINHVSGIYTVVSDLRMKKDIVTVGTVLPKIMLLQAKTYHYIDNKAEDLLSYGFIAQEVEKQFPDFVTTKGADGMKAVAYQNFSVIAIKAIQEQQQQIEELKTSNKILEDKIKKIEAAIEAIQQKVK